MLVKANTEYPLSLVFKDASGNVVNPPEGTYGEWTVDLGSVKTNEDTLSAAYTSGDHGAKSTVTARVHYPEADVVTVAFDFEVLAATPASVEIVVVPEAGPVEDKAPAAIAPTE